MPQLIIKTKRDLHKELTNHSDSCQDNKIVYSHFKSKHVISNICIFCNTLNNHLF